jgi:hypothetical protein
MGGTRCGTVNKFASNNHLLGLLICFSNLFSYKTFFYVPFYILYPLSTYTFHFRCILVSQVYSLFHSISILDSSLFHRKTGSWPVAYHRNVLPLFKLSQKRPSLPFLVLPGQSFDGGTWSFDISFCSLNLAGHLYLIHILFRYRSVSLCFCTYSTFKSIAKRSQQLYGTSR